VLRSMEEKPAILTETEILAIRKKPSLLNDVHYTPQITRKEKVVNLKLSPQPQNIPPKLNKNIREKFSSTATMFFNHNNSCLQPNVDDTLKCVAAVIHNTLLHFESTKIICKQIWDERKHPLSKNVDFENTPTVGETLEFLLAVFHSENFSAETAIMTIAYIDRFLTLSGSTFHASNWRRITLACIVVASKVWEDLAVWNADFLALFPCIAQSDLNSLEREMLIALDYVVGLKASIYCKYYFDLRLYSELNDLNFPLKQLTQEQQNKLENNSNKLEQGIRNDRFSMGKKSQSFDPILLKQREVDNESKQLT